MSEPETPTLFEVALYLICSSRNALDETLGYASMRLLDGAGRLTAAAGGAQPDAFLAEMLGRIDETKLKVMHDLAGYTAALEQIQHDFIQEAKRRNAIRS